MPTRTTHAVLCGLLLSWSSSAMALECSAPHTDGSSAIPETAADIATLSTELADDPEDNALEETIDNLRKAHPDASDAEIADYLTMAYCPVVAQRAEITEADASAKLGAFADRVMTILSQR